MKLPSKQRGFISLAGATLGAGLLGAGASILSGRRAAKASRRAAETQSESVDEATQFQREALQQTRQDLQPFREAGEQQIDPLTGLLDRQQQLATDPEAQRAFVEDNPFFQSLADESQRRIFQNQAARGKIGSGETAEALQNSILLLGQDLLNQGINRQQQVISNRQGITQLGQNAAARQATAGLTTGQNLANLATQRGNVQAAGQVGAANARTQGVNQAINAGLGALALAPNQVQPELQPFSPNIPGRRPTTATSRQTGSILQLG